ncbi:macrophage colony-stimulating factor 1 receptor 1-like [Anopheles coustani]|uniref:macrophage colony-stimulating factor 1 receptor 1-like n=1 Tax=Anopheles coustani TaxID=139045 RepID=UPI0026582296|nr:macrophage colony-stimulating factor 1 receptor 1-like [Anopheles coustani]
MLDCDAEGNPVPEIYWFENDSLLSSSNESYNIQGETLVIDNATFSHAGRYECCVTNDTCAEINLSVVEPYGSDYMMNNEIALLNDDGVDFSCYFQFVPSNPSAFYTPYTVDHEGNLELPANTEISRLLVGKADPFYPPYAVRHKFHIPGPIQERYAVVCSEGDSRLISYLMVRNFHEPMKLEIVSIDGSTMTVRCQVDAYEFRGDFIIYEDERAYYAVGQLEEYAWVVHHSLSINTKKVSCKAIQDTTEYLKKTIVVNSHQRQIFETAVVAIGTTTVICAIVVLAIRKLKNSQRKTSFNDTSISDDSFSDEPFNDTAVQLIPSEYEFSTDKLTLGETIGQGAFGVVRKAVARDIFVHEPSTIVAVKMLKANHSADAISSLATELNMMIQTGLHMNIVYFLGAVTKDRARGQIMLIFEYCQFGSMDIFLRDNAHRFVSCWNTLQNYEPPMTHADREGNTDTGEWQLRTTDLISWASQVANGGEDK